MINYLKLSAYFFLGVGVLFSLGIFALKIFFYDNNNDSLIILGPDNADVILKPSDPKGLKVPNLDVEILRMLAYKYEEFDMFDESVEAYEQIISIKPSESQAYRNLALSYQLNKQFTKAQEVHNKIYNNNLIYLFYIIMVFFNIYNYTYLERFYGFLNRFFRSFNLLYSI